MNDDSKIKGRRYPWESWFARGEITLYQDEDYNGLDSYFVTYVRRAAKRYGYRVSVNTYKGYVVVKVTGRTVEHPEVHNNKYRKGKK